MFPILKPKPLSYQRLMDFYKILPLIPKEHWDDFCPELKQNFDIHIEPNLVNFAKKCFDSSKSYASPESEEEMIASNREFMTFLDVGITRNSVLYHQFKSSLVA